MCDPLFHVIFIIAQLQTLCKGIYDKICKKESEKYDVELAIRNQEKQVNQIGKNSKCVLLAILSGYRYKLQCDSLVKHCCAMLLIIFCAKC